MKNRTMIVVGTVLALSLLVAGSAFACWGGGGHRGYGEMRGGYGMMGYYGPRSGHNVDMQEFRKFQKETLPLRDELITQRMELDAEYAKENPDSEKITTLNKGMIDIKLKIRKIAEKYNFPTYNRRAGSQEYYCPGPGGSY